MGEIDAYIELTQATKLDENCQNAISQVDEFERFLREMSITIEKKRILVSREDIIPHTVYLNY